MKKDFIENAKPILAQRLKELRKEHNLTQQEVADKINISRPAYSQYEIGKKEPRLYTLIAIADFYKISVDYLLGRL